MRYKVISEKAHVVEHCIKIIIYNRVKAIINKAIAMMRRKSPRSENIYLIENHCQANISK